MSNYVRYAFEDYYADLKKRLKNDMCKAMNHVGEELCNEASQMYETFIDQFYTYKTSSYSRHSVGIGTQTGMNLYRANHIKLKKTSLFPIITIRLDGSEMQSQHYNRTGYKYISVHDSADDVLNDVMTGWRFPYPNENYFPDGLSWSSPEGYHGKYFHANGTILEAFDKFGKEASKIAIQVFYEEWRKMGW